MLNKPGYGIVIPPKPFQGAVVSRRARGEDLSTVGGRIQAARLAKGLTQDQLAKRIGVSKGAISQWEANTIVELSARNILRLADELEVSLRWLLEYTDKLGHPVPMGQPVHLEPDQSDLVETFKLLEPEFRDALLGDAHKYLRLSASQQKPSRGNPYPGAQKPKKPVR